MSKHVPKNSGYIREKFEICNFTKIFNHEPKGWKLFRNTYIIIITNFLTSFEDTALEE